MRGNSAILKCLIPSFVADFVQVDAWVDEDGEEYIRSSDFNQGRKKISQVANEHPLNPFSSFYHNHSYFYYFYRHSN